MSFKYRYFPVLSVLASSLLIPALSEARTVTFACGGQKSLSAAIRSLAPGDVILVSGLCTENVVVPEEIVRVTIDGQGSATINGPSASQASVVIRGTNITLAGFTISGGLDGINVSRNGAATLSGNVIQSTGRDGVSINQSATARVTNNVIQNNPRAGITVTESASVRVGLLTFDGLETVPGGTGPNQILGNAEDGIRIHRSSSGIILGNTISSNGRDGVLVFRAAYADISSNVINSNGRHGINVGESSAVRLGEDAGTALDEMPNTTTINNGAFGINCSLNATLNGRIGSLTGVSGASNTGLLTTSDVCVNSLQ